MKFILSFISFTAIFTSAVLSAPHQKRSNNYEKLAVKYNGQTHCAILGAQGGIPVYTITTCNNDLALDNPDNKFMMDHTGLKTLSGSYVGGWEKFLKEAGQRSWVTNKKTHTQREKQINWYFKDDLGGSTLDKDGFGPIAVSHNDGKSACLTAYGGVLSLLTLRADEFTSALHNRCSRFRLI